jgi:hypothetical protein
VPPDTSEEIQFPCRPHSVSESTRLLPIYLLVAGVEGAGHHALESVWRGLQNYYDLTITTYKASIHAFSKLHNVSSAYQYGSIELDIHRTALEKYLVSHPGELIIDSRNSFPMGFNVGNLAHPDIVSLAQLDGDLIDFRVLFIHRDPTAAALSSVRRFSGPCPYKSYQWQARSCQESLTVMNNAIPSLKCGKFMYLGYEDFTTNPTKYNTELARLLSVDPQLLADCYQDLRPADLRPEEPSNIALQRQALNVFFDKQQVLWPLLTGKIRFPTVSINRANLPAKPQLHIDWTSPVILVFIFLNVFMSMRNSPV